MLTVPTLRFGWVLAMQTPMMSVPPVELPPLRIIPGTYSADNTGNNAGRQIVIKHWFYRYRNYCQATGRKFLWKEVTLKKI